MKRNPFEILFGITSAICLCVAPTIIFTISQGAIMKSTKRAYAKVRQNRPEDEREDTTQRHINGQTENDAEHHKRILEIHKNNPDPLFHHNRGQRFKHVSQDQPAYKHQSNRADIPRTPKPKTETQPTTDPAETNQ